MCLGVAHGVEESKGGDGEEEKFSDATAALAHAVAPVGAPSAAAAGLHGEGEVTENRAVAQRSFGSVMIK